MLAFFAVALVALVGMTALVVDVGYAYYVKRSLQASADAAATAGALELPDPAAAVSHGAGLRRQRRREEPERDRPRRDDDGDDAVPAVGAVQPGQRDHRSGVGDGEDLLRARARLRHVQRQRAVRPRARRAGPGRWTSCS